jgi:hypothetical protein
MNALMFVLREIWGAFMDDYGFTLSVLAWIFLAGFINSSVADEAWRSTIFLIGLLAILLMSIALSHAHSALCPKSPNNHI